MSELDRYDYQLPTELIAQEPLPHRSDARLMLVDRASQSIEHLHVRDLPDLLQPNDVLVLNNTRVLPARLTGTRTRTGGQWTGLFLETDGRDLWKILSRTRGKLQIGETVTLHARESGETLTLDLLHRLEDGAWAVRPDSSTPLVELLDKFGRVPLPPYIRGGNMVDSDRQRYQTVFASSPGAVAAPTAGLHFTTALLKLIASRGIGIAEITLHVGLGTFRPLQSETLAEHHMHRETGSIGKSTCQLIDERRRAGGRVIAVGTTSVRVLETASQTGQLEPWADTTDLFIRPPYTFQFTDALFTNFHLPRSTLLILVQTLGGDDLIREAYQQAITERYRFYSYGDAMLIV
ncbi:MAG: tRNA preQ1(34) S-adenosylmethionine ribosyltransferase-isomerase QueA [Planctomycetaceae bacterium]|nr:tRNA preQ1(34) S-adenosylmethionine ribosyltransferase-isomerase QueA [Planctomycetaceae bacterium]